MSEISFRIIQWSGGEYRKNKIAVNWYLLPLGDESMGFLTLLP